MSAVRYLADYHTHSRISPDARHPMTEMARAAAEAGLDEICFTDHVEPILLGSGALRDHYDWAALAAEYAAAPEGLGRKADAAAGHRAGRGRPGPAPDGAAAGGCAGAGLYHRVHPCPLGSVCHEGLYTFCPADEAEARRGIADYLDRVQALADWGGFDVLGHLTLPLRYLNELYGFHMTFDGFEPQMEAILRTVIRGGRGIELNTNRGHTPLPDEKWLRMYRELGARSSRWAATPMPPARWAHHPGNQALLRRCRVHPLLYLLPPPAHLARTVIDFSHRRGYNTTTKRQTETKREEHHEDCVGLRPRRL